MILNSATAIAMRAPGRVPSRTMCLATNTNIEQLRAQLDQLHSEAESTGAKAKSARLRLLRLSEAAEKLRRQAAISVQTGKENDARELLFQKKKVILALEKSKRRIELLDELSTKLNEAISVRESKLVRDVALDCEVGEEDASSPVRIISPRQENIEDLTEIKEFEPIVLEHSGRQDSQLYSVVQESLPVNVEPEDLQPSPSVGIWNEDDIISRLNGIFSYEDFLEHLDHELSNIEVELLAILWISTLVLDSKETPKNSKNWKYQKDDGGDLMIFHIVVPSFLQAGPQCLVCKLSNVSSCLPAFIVERNISSSKAARLSIGHLLSVAQFLMQLSPGCWF